MGEPIRLKLTGDEALVLFEFLSRSDDEDALVFRDQVQERVLWTLQSQLEKSLVEIFDPGYKKLVEAAWDRVRDPVD